MLPPVDRFLFMFELWLPGRLEQVPDLEHRKLLQRFATWHVLRQLRTAADSGPVGHYRNQNARAQLRRAAAFLADLARHGRDPLECRQADIDRWFAAAPGTQRQTLRPFPRIVRLTIDDVVHDGDQVLLRLGDPPIPIPAPFADVLNRYIASRPNLTTATNPGSRLLFPGRRAGQPIHPTSVRLRLQALGIPNLNGRTRAIRELLERAPAPVVAGMLGYGEAHAEHLAADAGSTWRRYAAGDHNGSSTPHRTANQTVAWP